MVDRHEPRAGVTQIGVGRVDLDRPEIDVEDRDVTETAALAAASAPAVDEVDMRIANALDRRNQQFVLADPLAFEFPRAKFDRPIERSLRVSHANADGADACAVLLGVARSERIRLGVDQKIHLALPVQRDVLADVPGGLCSGSAMALWAAVGSGRSLGMAFSFMAAGVAGHAWRVMELTR